MKRIIALLICMTLMAALPSCVVMDAANAGTKGAETNSKEASSEKLDTFSFSLTWGTYGISSYDSSTGKLVKTTDSTHPEDYITTYKLTEEQKAQIYKLIEELDITSYPDEYNPNGNASSKPSMTLILSVTSDTVQKTVEAADIAITYYSDNKKGQAFLDVCKAIQDILTATDEWEALPEYEFFYD